MSSCLSSTWTESINYDRSLLDLFASDIFDALTSDSSQSPSSDRRSSESSSSGIDVSEGIRKPFEKCNQRSLIDTSQSLCKKHATPLDLFCGDCRTSVCQDCVLWNHRGHHFAPRQDENVPLVSNIASILMTRQKTFAQRLASLRAKVDSVTDQIIAAAEGRRHELINQIKTVEQVKYTSWNQALNKLHNLFHPTESLDFLNDVEDDNCDFIVPDISLYHQIRKMGVMQCSVQPALCYLVEDITRWKLGQSNSLVIQLVDCLNQKLNIGKEQVNVELICPNQLCTSVQVVNNNDGTYSAFIRPQIEGVYFLHVKVKNINIKNSPFRVETTVWRDYKSIRTAKLEFGSESESNGGFCRPWGVCCDSDDRIIVADRSNNRIQIFTKNGKFVGKFGREGSLSGEFRRPAGVAADSFNNIVVSDKDNHRVQVFSPQGVFLFLFGEEGCRDGQFRYPWDVAVSEQGLIAVSDTKNHRIQLFTQEGVFVAKFGFEAHPLMWKQFDSPRGVCFTKSGKILVTDFNNHRLAIIDTDLTNIHFLGSEGSGPHQFFRPQGIAVDKEGRIAVADSRNHRVQIFETSGRFLWQFGTEGSDIGQFIRPQGICFTKDSHIVVVDFGNNRVQVF